MAGKVFGQRAHVGRNGHFVVVQNHQQVYIAHVARVVERFKGLPGGHCAIANNGNAAGIAAVQFVGNRHAECCADGCGRMPHAEYVVFAFAAFGKACQALVLAHGVHAVFAPREDFVGIGLMPHIPHQVVVRGVVNIMQGEGKLHRAEVAGEMPACFLDAV